MTYKSHNIHRFNIWILGVLSVLLLTSFVVNDTQRKLIKQDGFKVELYVLPHAKVKIKEGKTYFWYKSGEVHQSAAGYSGDILHGPFIKSFANNNLAEKGSFDLGLKSGVWQSWYEDGKLKESITFKKGIRNGRFKKYNTAGTVITQGSYSDGQQSGRWITGKDTLQYKKGAIHVKEEKKPFFQRVKGFFKKDSLARLERQQKRAAAKTKKAAQKKAKETPAKKATEKKENARRRVVKKKDNGGQKV